MGLDDGVPKEGIFEREGIENEGREMGSVEGSIERDELGCDVDVSRVARCYDKGVGSKESFDGRDGFGEEEMWGPLGG
ncbi:hypothetical protein ACLOJK_013084 [Asimina triloba]